MVRLITLLLLLTAACTPSKRFSLPAPEGPVKASVTWTWTETSATPQLTRGAAGDWDSVDVLNPSVVRWREVYWNLYSGFDGKTWHTGLAQSQDGTTWQRKGKILSPAANSWEGTYIAANGTALAEGHQLLYWYQGGRPIPSIGLARSTDGLTWTKDPAPVLTPGPRGSWDERGVADPYVIRAGNTLYLYYTGMDRALRQRLGVARSTDSGKTWQKSLDNPILDIGGHEQWDEGGLGEPAVWSSHGSYWMLYTGRAWDETRRIGLAKSPDGIHWQKLPDSVFAGAQPWNKSVICDPAVDPSNKTVKVWYGGGNKPSPDENLNGQIAQALLTPH
ncbi:hypothetical protein F183_A20070 [Bryobacterales bacterium F-183]|nr:hypothetical protein F183_A20070 [Bryobacterales bacterium F-183]